MMKILIALTLTALLLVAACDRQIESKYPTTSLPTEGQVPSNLTVQLNDQTVTLGWEVDDPSQVLRYRVYQADNASTEFALVDSTILTTITIDGLIANHNYYFQIAAVLHSGLEWDPSETVSAYPGHFSMTINSDREFVNSTQVSVQIVATALATFVMMSESSDFGGAIWLPFASNKSFTLSEGDGIKTVYARLQFSDGSTTGDPISDDVILDTWAEISTVYFLPSGESFSAGETITFGLDAGETGGSAEVSLGSSIHVVLFDDGTHGDVVADDGIYLVDWEVPPNAELSAGAVTGSFVDAAGNSAIPVVADELLTIIGPATSSR